MKRIELKGGLLAAALALAAAPALAKKPVPPPATWQVVTPESTVTGVDGKDYHPSCSGFPGTDAEYRFFVRKGKSDKTVVFFEGGGACWDSLTCSFPIGTNLPQQFFVPTIPPSTNPASYDGIFRSDRADNPVRDWNFVYIPYCTGDIHTGSATKGYTSIGGPLPAGTPFTLQHRGFDNFMAVLGWIKGNLGTPKQILVTGSSAGGYGATVNFAWIEDSFKTSRVSLIADASQGVTTAAFDEGNPGRNSWNPQLAPGVFGTDPSLVPGPEFMRRTALAYPRSKVAQFTTKEDDVQVQFYGVMKQLYGPGGSCSNLAVDWNQQMLGALQSDAAEVPNYRHYLAAGKYHTIMRSPLFYTEATDGVPFSGWVANMLKNQGGTGGSGGGWPNVACPDCLTALTCP
uniref:Lipoprotein n=1 Tax=uncultured microorganism TaxID=358574 RepID=F8UI00_9ZZZZ|nr:lipoprotein [uncultured microorganism]